MNASATEREALIADYRSLVQEAPSRRALERSLALLQQAAAVRIEPPAEIREALRSIQEEERSESAAQQQFREDVLEFIESELSDRALRRKLVREKLRVRQLAYEAAISVAVVPEFLEMLEPPIPRWRWAFVLDITLLVFHQAYFTLLEDLDSGMRAFLLESFSRLSSRLAPADRSRVRALTCDAKGEHALAEGYYQDALSATSGDAHEFMTLLQTAWSHMVEQGRYGRAMHLLLRNAAKVRERDLGEYRELVLTTIELVRSSGRAA